MRFTSVATRFGGVDRLNCKRTVVVPDIESFTAKGEDSLVRVVNLFVEELDLPLLGFPRSAPARTGRPGYHPAVLLKLFIYG
jgi:transposase